MDFPHPALIPITTPHLALKFGKIRLPSYDESQSSNCGFGEQTNMKNLFRDFDWGALQAFVAVVALPAMIIFGGFTILLWNN